MQKHTIPDPPLEFRPQYSWPEDDSQRACPKCGNPLQLNDYSPTYFGKPWWCSSCQWQFSDEELTVTN